MCIRDRSYGAKGIRVTKSEEINSAFEFAKQNTKAPTVIEFIIDREKNVLPIVPPGNALIDMVLESEEMCIRDRSWVIVHDAGKLLSCHPFGFTGVLDRLPYRSKIKVKIIIPFIHKLTTCSLKILPLYFTEMWFLIERCEISDNKRFNSLSAEMKEL